MKLYSRILGEGEPILILHGLFGMSDNWLTIGRMLAQTGYAVHLLDLRNHGRSPHADTHRYPDMCDDLLEYIDNENLKSVHLIGHSMGGKLSMIFTLLHPELVRKLVVVDIAPSDYRKPENTFHSDLIKILSGIDFAQHDRRGSVREELENKLKNRALAMFLAKNIYSTKNRTNFSWKFNLPVLQKFLQHLYIGLEELELHAPCHVPTLFVKGNNSDYYLPANDEDRQFFFPDSKVVGIDEAGHWVHSEQPEKFVKAVSEFL
jgi:pimeloyl-ACP methyl ester carboxylesterase